MEPCETDRGRGRYSAWVVKGARRLPLGNLFRNERDVENINLQGWVNGSETEDDGVDWRT